jgi:putative transposase
MVALASQYGRYGYRRITALLVEAGWRVGCDRVQRIWRREGLNTQKTSATRPALAERRLLHPAQAKASQSRLEL